MTRPIDKSVPPLLYYGRSPAMNCMDDIRDLQRLTKWTLVHGQREKDHLHTLTGFAVAFFGGLLIWGIVYALLH